MIINCYSVKWSSRINNVFSLGKIAGLVLITGFGVYYFGDRFVKYLILFNYLIAIFYF